MIKTIKQWLIGIFYLAIIMAGFVCLVLLFPFLREGQLNLWERLTGLSASGLAGFFAILIISILEILCVILIETLIWIKKRKPRVFISFKGRYQEIANELAETLKKSGFKPLILPYLEGGYTHDEVVAGVRNLLRKSDAVITVPDPEFVSFVDAELLAASVSGIPIALFKHDTQQKQPRTLLTGYAVFDHQNSRGEAEQSSNYSALIRYLIVTTRHPKYALQFLKRLLKTIFSFESIGVLIGLILLVLALVLTGYGMSYLGTVLEIGWMQALSFDQDFLDSMMMPIFLGMVGLFIYALGKAYRIQAIARQKVITGASSFEEFESYFSEIEQDKIVLKSLRWNDLPKKGK